MIGSDLRRGLAALLIVLAPSVARAEDPSPAEKAVAQTLFDDAIALMEQRRFEEACPKLEESERLDPGGGTLLNLGACYEQLGRNASAFATYHEALSVAIRDGRRDRESSAREHIAAVQPKLLHVRLEIPRPPASLEVRLDGRPLGAAVWGTDVPIDPGPHTVDATAPGHQAWSRTFRAEQGTERVDVALVPLAPAAVVTPLTLRDRDRLPPPAPGGRAMLLAGVGVLGAGAAAVIASAILGGAAFARKGDSDAQCPTATTCTPGGVAAMNDADALATASTVTFVAGLVAAGAGILIMLAAPRNPRAVAFAARGLVFDL